MELNDIKSELENSDINKLYLTIAEKKIVLMSRRGTLEKAIDDKIRNETIIEKTVFFDETYKNEAQRKNAIIEAKLVNPEVQKLRTLISELNLVITLDEIVIEALERKFKMYFK
jgi:RNA polymerase-interacting CarD/CdnL/TRCF family regulator